MLSLLDGPQTFQAIPEGRCRAKYTTTLHGGFEKLESKLRRLNSRSLGIFFAVNETDLTGRKAENITAVRTFYADIDGLPSRDEKRAKFHWLLSLPLPPSAVVETRNGLQSYHFAAAGTTPEQFERVQRGLVSAVGGDMQVRDIARILRVPGFYHLKKEPFTVRLIYDDATLYTAGEMLSAFPAPPPPPVRPMQPVDAPDVWTHILEGASSWAAPPQNRHLAMYLLGGVAHKFGVSIETAQQSLEPVVAGWQLQRDWQSELRRTVRDGHNRGPATIAALRNLGIPVPPLGRPS